MMCDVTQVNMLTCCWTEYGKVNLEFKNMREEHDVWCNTGKYAHLQWDRVSLTSRANNKVVTYGLHAHV